MRRRHCCLRGKNHRIISCWRENAFTFLRSHALWSMIVWSLVHRKEQQELNLRQRVVKVQWEIHFRLLDRDCNNESNVLCYFYFLVTKYLAESIYGRRIYLAHGINRLLQSKTKGRAWQSGLVYGGWMMQQWLVASWLTKETERASRTKFRYALLILTHIDLPLLGRHPPSKHFWK